MKLSLIFVSSLASGIHIFGQTPAAVIESAPKPAVRVLESSEVRHGANFTRYQRIAPPLQLPASLGTTLLAPPVSPATGIERPPREQKESRTLLLSATVYDHRFTEVSWWNGAVEFRAFSNVDFNHLDGIREIETADARWLLFIITRNASGEAALPGDAITALGSLSAQRAEYFLAPPPPASTLTEAILAPIDALHTFYDAHRESLAIELSQRETESAAAAQALRDQPPTMKDTVINFWPVKSRVYPTTGQ